MQQAFDKQESASWQTQGNLEVLSHSRAPPLDKFAEDERYLCRSQDDQHRSAHRQSARGQPPDKGQLGVGLCGAYNGVRSGSGSVFVRHPAVSTRAPWRISPHAHRAGEGLLGFALNR